VSITHARFVTVSLLFFACACTSAPATVADENGLGGKHPPSGGDRGPGGIQPGNPDDPGTTTSPNDPSPNGGPRSAACVSRDAQLQKAVDGARTSPAALLAVKDPACGTSVYVSGDPAVATKDTLWRIGSVTKTFTSAVILSLLQDGKLGLDDPLSKWVPNVTGTTGVTLRMLLNHTSGIFSYTESPAFDETQTYTPSQLVAMATANRPYFAPGQGWQYSNTNYVLLGQVAEAAGGAKIGALVRARALAKANLTHTFFAGEEPINGTLTKAVGPAGDDVTNVPNPTGPWSAGAIVSTGADLAEWVAALYDSDAVLNATTRALITANAVVSPDDTYGLGAELLPATASGGGGQVVGHTGEITGFVTDAFYFPEKKTSIIAIVDSEAASPNDVSLAAVGVLFAGK
jgi:D-alanyl-D-alanine carboxypeptidase